MQTPVPTRPIAFGFLHTVAATAGQTFVIALFLPDLKRHLGMGDAAVAGIFAAATVASALVLASIGRWIDRFDLLRYSLASAGLLAVGTIAAALAPTVSAFAAALFAVRLGGNALLTHVAFTATARYIVNGRGRALSLVSIGSSVGEAALGVAIVYLIDAWGWRATLAATGGYAFAVTALAAWLVRREHAFRQPQHAAASPVSDARPRRRFRLQAPDTRFFVLTAPLFVATPLIVTALIFHQAVVAEAKGLSLQLFAIAFGGFAAARIVSSLVVGPLVDRFGAGTLFTFHLLPFCAGVVVLAAAASPWGVAVYWVLTGITGGFGATLQIAVVAERVTPSRLGRVRSVYGSITILAAAAGPPVYGALITAGVSVSALLWGSVAAMIFATLLGIAAEHTR